MSSEAAALGSRRIPWVVVLAGLGVFLAADDQTSVVVLLPAITEDLGVAQDQFFRAAWIINGYILGYVVVMPLMGRAADSFGHGRVYALAMLLFCAGSAWVALAGGLTSLSIARAVQAVGAGALVPVSMAIVTSTGPAVRWPIWLGVMAAAAEAGALIGPLWGGAVSSLIGWRGVFWINLPLCLPIALAIWRMSLGVRDRAWLSIDYLGAALLAGSLASLAVALTNDPIEPRPFGLTAGLFAAAALFFLLFLLRENRARLPMIELSRFARRPLAAAFMANALSGAALIVALVNVPLFTNTVLGGSALDGGLNLMRLMLALAVGTLTGGWIASRFWPSLAAGGGALLAGIGYLGLATWGEDPGVLQMTLPLLAAGFGLGLVIAPLMAAVIDQVDQADRATWASLLTVVRLLGALVGVALLTTQGLSGFYAEAAKIPLDQAGYSEVLLGLEVDAYQDTFLVTAAVCFVALIPAGMLGKGKMR